MCCHTRPAPRGVAARSNSRRHGRPGGDAGRPAVHWVCSNSGNSAAPERNCAGRLLCPPRCSKKRDCSWHRARAAHSSHHRKVRSARRQKDWAGYTRHSGPMTIVGRRCKVAPATEDGSNVRTRINIFFQRRLTLPFNCIAGSQSKISTTPKKSAETICGQQVFAGVYGRCGAQASVPTMGIIAVISRPFSAERLLVVCTQNLFAVH